MLIFFRVLSAIGCCGRAAVAPVLAQSFKFVCLKVLVSAACSFFAADMAIAGRPRAELNALRDDVLWWDEAALVGK